MIVGIGSRVRAVVSGTLALLVLAACSGTPTSGDEEVRTVAAEEARQLIDDGAVLIDVRTPEEFSSGHLTDARNIDVQADSFHAEVRRLDRNATYVLYCRSGARAGAAGAMMRELGFTDVVNAGGFADLAARGLPAS